MLISQDVWHVSTGLELIRNGNQVTVVLAGSADGYYNPDLGYWEWYGTMEATFGVAYGYVEQYFDRPMDLSLTETLASGVATAGSYDVYGSPSASVTFGVILFDAAADYAGTAGIDYAFGSDQADRLAGAAGDDGLEGGLGDDWLNGGQGGDLADGGAGRDCASYAGAAAGVVARLYDATLNDGDARGDRFVAIENLEGSSFNDHLYGDDKANTLWGRDGTDTLFGRGGGNTLVGGKGADLLVGGGSADTASYVGAADRVAASLSAGSGSAGEALGDSFLSIENLTGTGFDDLLTGDGNANTLRGNAGGDFLRGLGGGDRLFGGNGDDLLLGGPGADWLDGFYGIDTASYAGALVGVQANLSAPGANTRDAAGDVYVSVENLTGSSFNDRLTGDLHENAMSGGDGNDSVAAGAGSDRVRGGAGSDTFVFDSALDALGNVDWIVDYAVADDRIQLDDAVFTALTPGGIGAAAFHTGTAAATADHRIVHNAANGTILYDADGAGGGAAIAFARVAVGLSLTAAEFFVI